MANKNTISIEIVVNDNGTATIKSFGAATVSELKKAEDAGDKLGAGFSKTWAGISAGAASVIYVFEKVKSAIEAPISAYMQSESALLKLGMAMKNQGDYSRAALEDLVAYAGALQNATAYEDDMTVALMGNLKSYGMTNEEVKRATKIAMDFATAKANEGMTITTASELIGKAYAGNTAMLGRYGITIGDTLKGSEKFAAVMDQLNARFGGSAQAELSTYAGQWKQLKNQWGEVQEFLGLVFLKTIEGLLFTAGLLATTFMTAGESILSMIQIVTSPFTFLLNQFAKLAELTGLTQTADALRSIASATEDAKNSITSAKEGVLAWTAKQYDAMVATDKVSTAIDNMGIAGKRTQAIDEEAARNKKQALEDITEAIRKASAEVEGIGISQYAKDKALIDSNAEKYLKAGVDEVTIAKYVAAETTLAHEKAYKEIAKAGEAYGKEYLAEREKEVAAGIAADEKILASRQQGIDVYKDLISEETEFAATENERAINKIIGQEEDKLNKIYQLYAAETISYEEMQKAEVLIKTNAAAAVLEKETETSKKIADLNYNLIKDISGYHQEAYDARIEQINAQAAADIQAGADYSKVMAKVKDDTKKAYIDMGKSGDDWVTGVEAGLLEITTAHTTWGKTAYELTKQFSSDASKAFGSNFKDVINGDFDDLGSAWKSLWDNMLTSLGESIGKMIIEAAANDILMMFKADWTSDSSSVLKIIGGAIDLWNSVSGSSSVPTDGGTWVAGGGYIRGQARVQGDSLANDTVLGHLSPGEYVMPRSAVNAETLPQLEYMRRNKRLRNYAYGGDVDDPGPGYVGMNDRKYPFLGEDAYADASALASALGKHFVMDSSNEAESEILKFWANGRLEQAAYNVGDIDYKSPSGWTDDLDMLGWMSLKGGDIHRAFYRDETYEDLDYSPTWGWGENLLSDVIKAATVAIMIALCAKAGGIAAVGAYGAGAASTGAAAGAGAAGALIGFAASGGDWQSALIAGVTAAAMSAIGSYFSGSTAAAGEIPADQACVLSADDFTAWQNSGAYSTAVASDIGQGSTAAWWANIMDSAKEYVSKFAVKSAIKIGAGMLGRDGSDQGSATFNYDSTIDNGVFAALSSIAADIAPKETSFAFSARNGLDYVPRDNFPILAHKGEAVLTETENADRKSGRYVHYTFNLYATVADKKACNELAEQIYPQIKKLEARGY